jgi:hypothetical protein
MTKDWIVGFTEAEGSFYVTKKDSIRYAHGFGVTQKKDKIVLEEIIRHLGVTSKVKYNVYGFYAFDVLDHTSLQKIKKYFYLTMKGIKSFNYRIWARSFRDKDNHIKLAKIQTFLRRIRNRPSRSLDKHSD